MQKLISFLSVAFFATILFTACEPKEPSGSTPTTDEGVVINGVKWATRNVGSTGTFVTNPQDYGEYYTWEEAQSACPSGWRLPTETELRGLGEGTWTTKGREFSTAPNKIFLPAAGCISIIDFSLYDLGTGGYYWSNPENSFDGAYALNFDSGSTCGVFSYYKRHGFSVRCVKE